MNAIATKPTLNEFLETHTCSPGAVSVSGTDLASNVELCNALSAVVLDIAAACIDIAAAISQGALSDSLGELDSDNVQGERQKQLDVISNDIFLQYCQRSGYVAGMASEEMEQPFALRESPQGKFLLLFDPLDGSSNINLNIAVGSIFSLLPSSVAHTTDMADFLQPGTRQLCAGYALYGPSTMLVLTFGKGVYGFTLSQQSKLQQSKDQQSGEFVLTHANMQIAAETSEFAINMSNQRLWQAPVQRYIAETLQGATGPRRKDFNMRWVASMVAEVHRLLVRGGVFLYPVDSRIAAQGGKLRLLYEANPMAMLLEQAGGAASTGLARILYIQPERLHQRVPVMLGAREEVQRLVEYHQQP